MEILLLIVGAMVGVIADMLFRQPILRFILQIKRKFAILTKRADPFAGKPNQLRFGNLITDWVSIHGTGELPLRPKYLRADLLDDEVSLPTDLQAIRLRWQENLERKSAETKADIWNGQHFALVKFYPTRYGVREEPGLNFEFKLSDYAAHAGITRQADKVGLVKDSANNPITIRDKYFPYFDPESSNPYLTHAFGINLLVITKDHKVIIVQRNALVAQRQLLFNTSVNEAMQYPQDIDEYGKPSFVKTTIRGLWEELGIEFSILGLHEKSIEFLNFGALANANEYALLGRIKLPINAREVEDAYHMRAKDAGVETKAELYAVDYLPDAILEFVSTHFPWTDNGLANLYYAMVREWGYWEIKSAFTRHSLNWHIRQDST